jgi:transposase
MIGNKRVQSSSKRWRDAYRKRGIAGLQDNRKDNSGRPSEKELSAEEKLKRLESKVRLLEAENELLKKLDMMERGTEKDTINRYHLSL